jgi:hypothetical protein
VRLRDAFLAGGGAVSDRDLLLAIADDELVLGWRDSE